jgi:hypothetical protein
MAMHTDENKRFDRRNIKSCLRRGLITQKDYESYLLKLPDVSDKMFPTNEEDSGGGKEHGARDHHEMISKKTRKRKR